MIIDLLFLAVGGWLAYQLLVGIVNRDEVDEETGEKIYTEKYFQACAVFLIMTYVIWAGFFNDDDAPEKKEVVTATEKVELSPEEQEARKRDLLIRAQLHWLEGYHKKLASVIKAQIPYPETFEHLGTSWVDRPDGTDHVLVSMEFAALTEQAGRVEFTALALVDIDGNILEYGVK